MALAAVWSVVLAWWDQRHLRLPDWLTLPAVVLAFGLCCFYPSGWWGLVWPGLYLLVAMVMGGRSGDANAGAIPIGGGDIKLAVPLGVGVSLCGGVIAVLGAIVCANVITVVAGITSGKRYGNGMPHGPAMVGAAWLIGVVSGGLFGAVMGPG
ncbi:A24 family peptidase [Corynebacterium aquatimens]